MAYKKEKEIAIVLRKKGMSYNMIREHIRVSKSTLSLWLEKYPLTSERLKELRSNSTPNREAYRETMRIKREARILVQAKRVAKDLGKLSRREFFVAGFFLYWGEGAKGRRGEVSVANTDPSIIRSFLKWLALIGAQRDKCHFTLHLYADMNPEKEIAYWMNELGVAKSAFYKPYIKKTNLLDITYRNGFGHGTCNARYASQDLNDYVLTGLDHIRRLYE